MEIECFRRVDALYARQTAVNEEVMYHGTIQNAEAGSWVVSEQRKSASGEVELNAIAIVNDEGFWRNFVAFVPD